MVIVTHIRLLDSEQQRQGGLQEVELGYKYWDQSLANYFKKTNCPDLLALTQNNVFLALEQHQIV